MRDAECIDYGRLGPDVILSQFDVQLNLGIAYGMIGDEEQRISCLLKAWDLKRNDVQTELVLAAFLRKVLGC